jgi:NhaP-type Na+/H+ or K+/H+ antiporter
MDSLPPLTAMELVALVSRPEGGYTLRRDGTPPVVEKKQGLARLGSPTRALSRRAGVFSLAVSSPRTEKESVRPHATAAAASLDGLGEVSAMHSPPLLTIALAILLGVAGQMLASLLRLPAIVFLLVLGLSAGPHGLDVIRPASLGDGLPVIVSAFVAIILFEGGLTLRPDVLRQGLVPVRRLITWGAAVTLVGAMLLAHFLTQLPWSLAGLFAALVMVTGPTVIAPILRRVRLRPQLAAILKAESILIDAVGVLVAVVICQYTVGLHTEGANWREALTGFACRAGVGMLVGGLAGVAAASLVRLRLFHEHDNEHLIHLAALGLALGVYAGAEHCQHDCGVMAVVVAGLVLAASPLPFREEVEKFKEHLTTLGVSVLFILLAANLDLTWLNRLGWRELALLSALMLVVRPTAVLVSTHGTAVSWREKAYLSLMAPRGILAAAMASYFAAHLRGHGIAGGTRVEGLVFLTICATVCLQGGGAGLLARLLRVRADTPAGVLLVGINPSSLALAEELRRRGRAVLLLDNNVAKCLAAEQRGFAARHADATRAETYRDLDRSALGLLAAMTANDTVNSLVCDAATEWFNGNVLQVLSGCAGEAPRAQVRRVARLLTPITAPQKELDRLLRLASAPSATTARSA